MTTAAANININTRLPLHVATPVIEGVGNSFGYAEMIRRFHIALNASPALDLRDDAKVALHFCEPGCFRPIFGKRNILYTMWESRVLDEERARLLGKADAVIVPSQFSLDVLRPYMHESTPIRVVGLGVDPEECAYIERDMGKNGSGPVPFLWLWVGAPNPRKGWDVVGHVWNAMFVDNKSMMLYMKTSGAEGEGIKHEGNVVFDYRSLDRAALVELYQLANGFIFPTAGEGFGLTLIEAMATGCPCITTRYSGVLDFTAPDTVFYADFDMVDTGTTGGIKVESALARPRSVADCMVRIMQKYRAALRVGKKASREVSRRWTWEIAGDSLVRAVSSIAAQFVD